MTFRDEFRAGWRKQGEIQRRLWPWLLVLTLLTALAHWLLFGRVPSTREVIIEGSLVGMSFALGLCAPRNGVGE